MRKFRKEWQDARVDYSIALTSCRMAREYPDNICDYWGVDMYSSKAQAQAAADKATAKYKAKAGPKSRLYGGKFIVIEHPRKAGYALTMDL